VLEMASAAPTAASRRVASPQYVRANRLHVSALASAGPGSRPAAVRCPRYDEQIPEPLPGQIQQPHRSSLRRGA
jgi:hypothetical protein